MIMLESTTRISNGSSFQGNLSTAGKLIVAGTIKGNTNVHGVLQINASGRCDGNIEAEVIVIDGKVEGDIYAKNRLEIHTDAVVYGNIFTPALSIEDGAKVTGLVNVGKLPKLTLVEGSGKPSNVSILKPESKDRLAKYG